MGFPIVKIFSSCFVVSNPKVFCLHFLSKMDSKMVGTFGSEAEVVRLDEPI